MKFNRKKHLKRIARKGGLARIKSHGNPGTPIGRKLGGLKSVAIQRKVKNSPFAPSLVIFPEHSTRLAEFIGILLGDGSITARQVVITLHKVDDKKYANYTARLAAKLFSLEVRPKERKKTNVNIVVLSRTLIVRFLNSMGLETGSKIRNQTGVPDWIKNNTGYRKMCLRGLFDTDGCFYVDKHVIKDKTYENAGMNFTNRSIPLLNFFKTTLDEMGFLPTQSSKYSITLRKEADIVRYFREIGSSNPKHSDKFKSYQYKKGRVPKRS
ncbi:MAG: LAGLIDADG family homing endonuclease [bacterium]